MDIKTARLNKFDISLQMGLAQFQTALLPLSLKLAREGARRITTLTAWG